MKFLIWPMLLFVPYMLYAKVTVVKQTSNSVIFEFQMENLTRTEVQDGSEKYIQYLFDDGIFDQDAGFPAITSWRGRLAVPVGSVINFQVSVLESESHTGEDIIPQSYSSLSDIPLSLIRNDSVYSVPYPFPGENIKIGEQYDFRGSNVVSLQINPIQYYPAEHRVDIHKRIQVTIIFQGGRPLTSAKKMSSSERRLLSNKIINFDQAALFSQPVAVRLQKIMANYDFSTGQWLANHGVISPGDGRCVAARPVWLPLATRRRYRRHNAII